MEKYVISIFQALSLMYSLEKKMKAHEILTTIHQNPRRQPRIWPPDQRRRSTIHHKPKPIPNLPRYIQKRAGRRGAREGARTRRKSTARWAKTSSICLEASHQDAQKCTAAGRAPPTAASSSALDPTSLTAPPPLAIAAYSASPWLAPAEQSAARKQRRQIWGRRDRERTTRGEALRGQVSAPPPLLLLSPCSGLHSRGEVKPHRPQIHRQAIGASDGALPATSTSSTWVRQGALRMYSLGCCRLLWRFWQGWAGSRR
jgi:hypothetical protein